MNMLNLVRLVLVVGLLIGGGSVLVDSMVVVAQASVKNAQALEAIKP